MWFVVCLCCVIIITSWVVCVADVQSSLSFSSCRVSCSCQLFAFKKWPACSCPGQECCALQFIFLWVWWVCFVFPNLGWHSLSYLASDLYDCYCGKWHALSYLASDLYDCYCGKWHALSYLASDLYDCYCGKWQRS